MRHLIRRIATVLALATLFSPASAQLPGAAPNLSLIHI